MYDIHSHILPGIDDGAKTLADSIELLRQAERHGTRAIAATPHIRDAVWPNRRAAIATLVEEVRAEIVRQGIGIEIHLGAEIFFAFEALDAVIGGDFPTYADQRRYLLLELPNHFVLRQVQQLVFDFRTRGITPVLAHPERNPQLMADVRALEELVRMGALSQVTAMSVTGKFGRTARRAAFELLDRGLVHVVASDAHHAAYRPPPLGEAYERIAARHGKAHAELILVDNPRRILEGGEVEGGIGEVAERRGLGRLLARVLGG